MHAMMLLFAAVVPAAAREDVLEPWAAKRHPQDVAKRHAEDITVAQKEYRVRQGGTMDGTNCRTPIHLQVRPASVWFAGPQEPAAARPPG